MSLRNMNDWGGGEQVTTANTTAILGLATTHATLACGP
jgi:hypothetical protein